MGPNGLRNHWLGFINTNVIVDMGASGTRRYIYRSLRYQNLGSITVTFGISIVYRVLISITVPLIYSYVQLYLYIYSGSITKLQIQTRPTMSEDVYSTAE